mgnify:CR=1 FL=1
MNENEMIPQIQTEDENFDFEELESKLEEELQSHLEELKVLQDDYEKIEDPNSIGEVVGTVVWEQFINQIGTVAGEDFIKENRGLNLDLRPSAHIQTSENFADGKLATHNTKIDYKQRYDDWQKNFQHDENGNVIMHTTRTGKQEATLVNGARMPFDKDRPSGSVENGTDMDHTVSAGEIIRDPAANAHLTKEEQIGFANSETNLNEMDAGQNRSKGDKTMSEWLDNPNSKGQKPFEIFDISEEQEQKYREKDKEARDEYEKRKKEGEQRSIETGKQSQKEEAFRIGGKALQAILMGLLAALVKDVIRGLIAWFRSAEKSLKTFLNSLKQSIIDFFSNLKKHLKTAGKTFLNTIMTAIWGPIVGTINKAIIFLKQGYKSFKEAIRYLKDPQNREKPFSIKLLQVGKIITAGLVAGGAILLGEAIEKGLMNIPGFAFPIPMLGSLASLLGIFFGALISGIIGALALRELDKAIANKQKKDNEAKQIETRNKIIGTQVNMIKVGIIETAITKTQTATNISERHQDYESNMGNMLTLFNDNSAKSGDIHGENKKSLDEIDNLLNNL